ncbi:hypothetical protein ASD24_24315 [Paenibacillus sp. Root52]|uniref:hypothetical protein n=1 Tax=Paenibacillus sp. Root52 TaxID=1736552 RepID=UPI0006FCCE90|nr:hypothetical protein [Paenibacillus sp. Root52]KQY90926.1 hypothetical protein ASD24_24315 [Paenibacillus sp. Root52]
MKVYQAMMQFDDIFKYMTNIKEDNVEFIKSYYKKHKLLLILLGLATGIPILISQFIRIPTGSWTIGNEEAWVSFFGSYLGGIIGGIITLYVFKKTIENQAQTQSDLLKHQEEIRKLSMKPYFTAKTVKSFNNDDPPFNINYYVYDVEQLSSIKSLYTLIRIENVGMGNAIRINFIPEPKFYTSVDLDPLTLKVGNSMIIKLSLDTTPDKDEFILQVNFTDLMGHKYSQNIKLLKFENEIVVSSISEPRPVISI